MGLASYGNATPMLDKLENIVLDVFDSNLEIRSQKITELVNAIVEISKNNQSIKLHLLENFDFNFKDLKLAVQAAANTQALVQTLYCKQVTRIASFIQNVRPNTKDLMLTGGFTLNCPSNTQLNNSLPTFNVKPLPACGDTGIAIGGAVALNYLNKNKKLKDQNLAFKFAAFPKSNLSTDDEIVNTNLNVKIIKKDTLSPIIANLLSQNKILCVHRGRSEVGPRALGNRSIIALATHSKTRDLINKAKGRENWRPLAPICCDVDFNDYFEGDIKNSQFMLFTNKVKTNLTNAVRHVDNSARVQCLYDRTEWLYRSLQLLKLKGIIPVIVNTSFNCSGEPIVESLEQSINSFQKMNFDFLIYNNNTIIFTDKNKIIFENALSSSLKNLENVKLNENTQSFV